MANEEIIVAIGGSTSGLATALRGAKGIVQDFKNSLSEMFGQFGSAFMGAQLISGIKKIISEFDDLGDRAQNLSISTDFLQGMQEISSKDAVGGVETFNRAIGELSAKLGEAKDGGEEAIKKFQKWGFTLADIQNLNTEEMFYKIADGIRDTHDPALRSAEAFDLLGKAGKNLTGVLQGGSDQLKSMVGQVEKLSKADIETLSKAQDELNDINHGMDLTFAKVLLFVTKNAPEQLSETLLRAMGVADFRDPSKGAIGADVAGNVGSDSLSSKSRAGAIAAAMDAYQKTNEEIAFRHAGLNGQLQILEGQRGGLQLQDNGADGADKINIENQIQQIDEKILDTKKKISDEVKNTIAKQKELRSEMSKIMFERQNINAQYGTLQEVATSGTWSRRQGSGRMVFNQGPLAQEAQEAISLDAQAHQARLMGNKDYAKQLENRSSQIKLGLEGSEAIAPTITEHLKALNEKFASAQSDLSALRAKADGDGLKIQWPDE